MQYAPALGLPLAHGPAVEDAIRRFYATGQSTHTADSPVLPPLLNALELAGVAFTLRFAPGHGYVVERGGPSLTEIKRVEPRPWVVAHCDGQPVTALGLG